MTLRTLIGVARSQDEILARYQAIASGDADFENRLRREVLFLRLDFEHVLQVYPGLAKEFWEGAMGDYPTLEAQARAYLAYAVYKVRAKYRIGWDWSVLKLREFAWLMGRDDVVAAMDDAEHTAYEESKVRQFADGMGWPWMDDAELKAARCRIAL